MPKTFVFLGLSLFSLIAGGQAESDPQTRPAGPKSYCIHAVLASRENTAQTAKPAGFPFAIEQDRPFLELQSSWLNGIQHSHMAAFSQNGMLVGFIAEDQNAYLLRWIQPDGSDVQIFHLASPGPAFRVFFTPDGKSVGITASYSDRNTERRQAVRLYSLKNARAEKVPSYASLAIEVENQLLADQEFVAAHPTIGQIAFSWTGDFFVTSNIGGAAEVRDNTLRMWSQEDSEGWPATYVYQGLGVVTALALSPTVELVFATDDGLVRIFDPVKGLAAEVPIGEKEEEGKRILLRDSHAIRQLVFSPDGSFLVGAGDGGEVRVWDVEKGYAGRQITQTQSSLGGTDGAGKKWFPRGEQIVFDRNGERFAVAFDNGRIAIWEATTGKLLQELTVPRISDYYKELSRKKQKVAVTPKLASVTPLLVRFSPQSNRMIAVLDQGIVASWTLEDGKLRYAAQAPTGRREETIDPQLLRSLEAALTPSKIRRLKALIPK